jgi:lysophospholipase L1-like esterase
MSAPNDDSDLEDLISKSTNKGGSTSSMNIEVQRGGGSSSSSGGGLMTPLSMICSLISLCSYSFPRLSKCILIIGVFTLLSFIGSTIFNPTIDNHKMGADYSAINSAYELSLSKVDHWCVRGDNDSCKCENPLEASPRSEFKSWNAAHKANVAEVNLYRALFGEKPAMVDEEIGSPRSKIDVAFLGESVVEAMDGRWLGKHIIGSKNNRGENDKSGLPMINKTFEKLFRKDKGGKFEGIALGIAGDTTSNVLWRIMNDEMPYDFNPKVWWLVLGMNDLTRMQCSEEIVVLGILRVVEEIRLRKPDAKIVINSLLPMVNYQNGDQQPKMADVADFTADRGGGSRGKYRNKEDRYQEERKREVPATFKVRGNDDQVGDGENDKRGRGGRKHRMLKLHQKDNESDEDFEQRKLDRRTKKQKNNNKGRGDNEEVGEKEVDGKRKKKEKLTKKQREEMEDNATEGEELEHAIERKKKKLEKEDKKIRNQAFRDDEKYRPKRPVSKFLPMIKKKVLPPVWPSVHLINDKLKQFCTKHDSITFFDATEFFASKEEGGRHHLYNELISPRGHPTELGFQRWEHEIRDRLQKLIPPEPEEEEEKENISEGEVTDDYTILEGNDDGVEVVDEGATSEGAKNNDAEETGQAHEDNDDEEEEE